MTTLFSRLSFAASVVGILLATSGCTIMIKPPAKSFTGYPPAERINLNVGLQLTDELRKAKWEKHSMGDTWVIPIGKAVAENAGVLARQTFSEVVDLRNDESTHDRGVDAVLTPKVAYINRTQGRHRSANRSWQSNWNGT